MIDGAGGDDADNMFTGNFILKQLIHRYKVGEFLTAEELAELHSHLSTKDFIELERGRKLGQADIHVAAHITPITNGRSELQIAQEYRDAALKLLDEVAALITRARREDSMVINFGMGLDAFGRTTVSALEITKKLC